MTPGSWVGRVVLDVADMGVLKCPKGLRSWEELNALPSLLPSSSPLREWEWF